MKKICLVMILTTTMTLTQAQNPSAIMDLESTSQGVLIPRMDSTQRKNIANPSNGLLVYDLNTFSFWYLQDDNWVDLNQINRTFENANGIVRNTGNRANDDFVFGSPQLDDDGSPIHANRFFFEKATGAFRVGRTTGSAAQNWNKDSLGALSFAMGEGNLAKGMLATAWGERNIVTGPAATSWGGNNRSKGTASTSWGLDNIATQDFSTAWGVGNSVVGQLATAWGLSNKAQSYMETVLGTFADTLDHANSADWEPDDFLLVVGNGISNENRSNALTILKNGKMGLNMTEPNQELTIFDNDAGESAVIRLFSNTGSSPDMLLGFNQSNGPFLRTSSNHALKFQINGASTKMIINTNGQVGIGTGSPSEILDVNGNARFRTVGAGSSTNDLRITSDGTLTTNTSDLRLKENVETLQDALTKITQMRGVSFTWKNDPLAGVQNGLIAQEVLEVVPELVHKNGEYYGVDYSEMVGLFVEAIKEQQRQIENQDQLLREFRTKFEELEQRDQMAASRHSRGNP